MRNTVIPYLLALIIPSCALAFLVTGPHHWAAALAWIAPIPAAALADRLSPKVRGQPAPDLAKWPFDLLLYVMAALQCANMIALPIMASHLTLASPGTLIANLATVALLVGTSSGFIGIVVAHELIHRQGRAAKLVGRLLLATVCYEHFATEHVRGHHVRVGTPDDPASARFGESWFDFWKRSVPGQFRSAWRLECARLGDRDMRLWDARMLRHRGLHGVLFEVGIATTFGVLCGPFALLAFLAQAEVAIANLETANYFEHWGLSRAPRSRVTAMEAWDSDSAFTFYCMLGLPRHSDHHVHASRPYQQLRHVPESPKLPYGYFMMLLFSQYLNARFQKVMASELERLRLGPFRAAEPVPAPAAAVAARVAE